ncbi:MAG: hypothetical protein GXP29_04235 [Planctomycetes bacterium]|nr:hypothetical protein [Planctomycetota bacterium]
MAENVQSKRSPKGLLLTGLLIFASLALPTFFWKGTWFGTRLTDEQISNYLAAKDEPQKTQHALEQLTERIKSNDPNVNTFFPLLPPLAEHKRAEVRMMAAWVMGWDTSGKGFQKALRALVEDPVALVRRNAALALSKFADRASKPVLLAMLAPFEIKSPVGGQVSNLLQKGRPVRAGMEIAHVRLTDGSTTRIESPVSGSVKRVGIANGSELKVGDTIYEINPAEEDMWEALRALVLVGDPEDIKTIKANTDRYGKTPRLETQADLTCKAIEKRAKENQGE